MADAAGMSQPAVARIWRAATLRPPRAEALKLSRAPPFVEARELISPGRGVTRDHKPFATESGESHANRRGKTTKFDISS